MPRQKFTKEEIIKDLQRFYKETKQIPTSANYKGICSKGTIFRLFSNWNNALEIAKIPILKKTPEKPQLVACKNCNIEFYKQVKEILKTNNHFCTQSCAATYNNKHKKTGTRRAKLEIWLEKQIENLYPKTIINYNKINENIKYELDIFIPELKLGFELNGIFHYESIYGKEKLKKIKSIDKEKLKLCKKNGIKLIVIDTRVQKNFSTKSSQKFLDIIISEIESILFLRSFKIKI